MKRKKKIETVAAALKQNLFGTPLSTAEYRWIAENVVDALKAAKKRDEANR